VHVGVIVVVLAKEVVLAAALVAATGDVQVVLEVATIHVSMDVNGAQHNNTILYA
jgi:hypothetical protein